LCSVLRAFLVARHNPDGGLDISFGDGGKVITNFPAASSLAIQPDGKNANGTLNETFGAAGKAVPVSGSFDVSALALRQDGKIVVAGTYLSPYPANKDFALARYNGDGTLDGSFGVGGTAAGRRYHRALQSRDRTA
jgi:uncharacterized delta-60 repeat protein